MSRETRRNPRAGILDLTAITQPGGSDASPLRPPTWVQPSTILSLFQSGHGWTTNAGSTLAADTSTFVVGNQSARITTSGAGGQANLSRTGMTPFSATAKNIRLRFRVADLANVTEIGCFLGTTNFTAYYKWSFQVLGGSKFAQSGEWATMTLSWHDATTTGSPNRAALTDARLYVIDTNAGTPAVVNWQSMELVPDKSDVWPNGVITIGFDDSYAAQWTLGKKTLDQYGFPGVAYTIGDYIGGSGRLTLAQLKSMQDHSGWEIAAHAHLGVNHSSSYTGMSKAQLEADIRAQHAWLLANGFRGADGTAYPLGQFGLTADGQSTTDIVRANWGYARTTHSRTKETLPPADRWRLRAMSAISTASGGYAPSLLTAATTGDIDRCKTHKTWLMLVFHDILASGTPTATSQITAADFDSIIAAIDAAGVPVRTVSEVLSTL